MAYHVLRDVSMFLVLVLGELTISFVSSGIHQSYARKEEAMVGDKKVLPITDATTSGNLELRFTSRA